MQLQTKTVRQGINKAYLKVNVKRADLDRFKEQATAYLNQVEEAGSESEEHLKGYLKDFLSKAFYEAEEKLVNTSDRIDLAVYSGKTTSSSVDVIIEAKRPDNKAEMISKENPNRKALQEALHYYFDQRESGNDDIKHVIVTNYIEFFIFDAQEIERHFYSIKKLVKSYRQWKNDEKVSGKTDFIYKKFEAFMDESDASLTVTHADLKKYQKQLAAEADEDSDKKLIPLYKLFSPEHLVKKNFANDSNSLDKGFYNELLHILGLQEVKEKGSRLIQRLPENERHRGSLIENTIEILRYDQHMNEVRDATVHYGDEEDDQLFGVALELVITWMNRVLFLKLMEAQLLAYHNYDEKFKFLSFETIDEYDELNKLFFRVLALRNAERPASVQERFGHIPYLNSSLFDSTKLEKTTIQISGLDDKATLDLHSRSILKKGANPPKEKLSTLDYLLRFLDAYNFSAESSGGIQTEDKTLINASVLGLIFEKINGYKDGSFFTPGFITEYMARETLRKSVTDKLNEAFGWECEHFDELPRKIESKELSEVNEVINSITICDPAVGSGHFLVSCLNELIAIKSELKVLVDHEGKYISRLDISVENDELAVEHNGELFEYKLNHEWKNGKVTRKPAGKESQRIQEALFHEKKFLIENCLFGVDINPNSVKICRLRLWIELLKHAYYKSHPEGTPEGSSQAETSNGSYSELEVLPNIDINIKQGNSLVSRFGLDEDLSSIFKKSEHSLDDYKQAVKNYRETRDRSEKQRLQTLIDDIKAEYSENLLNNKPINKKLSKARGKLELMQNEDLFGEGKASKKELKKQEKKVAKLEEQKAEEEAGAFYREAFEWRFEFPEVLDDAGNYIGFDVVIGNPPYIRIQDLRTSDTLLVDYISTKFKTAGKGNYDLYIPFFELATKLISSKGNLCYINPHKFTNANYGENLRSYLASNKILHRVIHFGTNQVFPEATTYTGLFFGSNEDSSIIEFYKPENPEVISDLVNYDYEDLPNEILTSENWAFVTGSDANLYKKLTSLPNTLEGLTERIFQGLKTSADAIFIVEKREEQDESFLIYSSQNEKEFNVEKELFYPLIKGGDSRAYSILETSKLILFPYENSDLIDWNTIESDYPKTTQYLKLNKKYLENRERGRMKGDKWFGYVYPKALEVINKPKIFTPDIAPKPRFSYDFSGNIFFTGGASGGYGILPKENVDVKFLLGVLNSSLTYWFISKTSTRMRGDWLSFESRYISPIPFPEINSPNQKRISTISNQILTAKKENPEADTSKLEAEIDQLVYELYGLTEEEIAIVEESVG